jgi:hypothetical protein
MLNVEADGNPVPLRVTRYHRQLERLSIPLYLDPSPQQKLITGRSKISNHLNRVRKVQMRMRLNISRRIMQLARSHW